MIHIPQAPGVTLFPKGADLPANIKKIVNDVDAEVLVISESLHEPIELTWDSDTQSLCTVVEENVQVTIIERQKVSATDARMTHTIHLGARSRCNILSEVSSDTLLNFEQKFFLKEESEMVATILASGNVQHTCQSTCEGAGARSSVNMCLVAKGSEKPSTNTQNIFAEEHGGGELFLRGIAFGKTKIGIRGGITILEGGRGTNTYLTQEALLLSKEGSVDAIPGLEIRTNDVKASHSASVTRVTPEDLFYMQSRGLSKEESHGLFVRGFIAGIGDRAGSEILEKEVLKWVKTIIVD